MLRRFLLKTILYFCVFVAGFFLFTPSIFAVEKENNSHHECDHLGSYLSVYRNNDPAEMLKLQTFLKEHEDLDVKLSGVFDSATIIAVREFQVRYSEDILAPWGLSGPTGNVSITTRHKINDLYCGVITPLSYTEKEIIQNYNAREIDIHDAIDNTDQKEVSQGDIITPTVTIEPLVVDISNDIFPYHGSDIFNNIDSGKISSETSSVEVSSEESKEKIAPIASTSIGIIGQQTNLPYNGGMIGIHVGLISKFSLPILITLAMLLMAQFYFFWRVPIRHKLRLLRRRF